MVKYFGLFIPRIANLASNYRQNQLSFVFQLSLHLIIHSFILRMQAILATNIHKNVMHINDIDWF